LYQLGECFYCGHPGSDDIPNGCDRRDNNDVVYNTDTAVCCCCRCNIAKRDKLEQVFLQNCKNVAEFVENTYNLDTITEDIQEATCIALKNVNIAELPFKEPADEIELWNKL
jgi:hypothetical protein